MLSGRFLSLSGASSGIGRAAALLFAKNKYQLSLTGRNETALKEVAKECVGQGISENDVIISATDLAADNAPKTIVDNTIKKFEKIDSLVNSAGILRAGEVLNSDINVYDELFNVNVRCLVRLTREALPHIIKSKGTVVNVSSINGPCPFPGVTYYCMSKSAVDQFTKCLALEMAPHGVRVNAVNPGVTVTNLHRRSGQDEKAYAAFLERSKTTHALGRPGDPKEVAEAILFLASERRASSGIGAAIALLLARKGYALSLSGRDEDALKKTVKSCFDAGAPGLCFDCSDSVCIKSKSNKSDLNLQINCAGILTSGNIIDTGVDVYDRQMEVNVRSVVMLTRMALPYIIKTKGTIVNVSSIAGPCPFPGVAYYCMSKAAIDQFTKCLALEMAPHGVRVNAVNPGVIVTEVHKRSGMDDSAYEGVVKFFQFLERSRATHALGRVGEPSEVAEAVLFLASNKSSFTTGQLLKVDGGRGIMHPR
ncbi:unnamed protein product [Haemonchus placei]|uniref:Uncharacterized protein n=1 Tax=Haemonchus placei TaxID=6290 RepID=A0A3P7ZY24_HAEPC|nr:unnamed protein product [Haemonchus placei]